MNKLKTFNKKQIIEIKNLYLDKKLSPFIIGRKFNSGSTTIRRLLYKLNIYEKNRLRGKSQPSIKKYTKEIINKYLSGISTKKLSEEYNTYILKINRLIKNNGIQMRGSQENIRTYYVNYNFFDEINTEEKAYFLGFLYADGHVSYHLDFFKLKLHEKDEEILIKLNNIINNTRPISSEKDRPAKTLKVSNKYMVNKLIELGCTPRKSLTLQFPNNKKVPDFLISHFIRGYFDGDGHIGYNIKKKYYSFSIVGSIYFIESLNTLLNDKLNINSYVYIDKRHIKIRVLRLRGKVNIIKFLNFIYNNSRIFLARKYNIYKNISERGDDVNCGR